MDTSARAQESSPLSISTIGEELTITGNVTSTGELHLNGQVQGDVRCVALVLVVQGRMLSAAPSRAPLLIITPVDGLRESALEP
jgi:cytoskeletal protein CcmA (bactofilin family)